MGVKRPENIGRYYYYVSNISDTTDFSLTLVLVQSAEWKSALHQPFNSLVPNALSTATG